MAEQDIDLGKSRDTDTPEQNKPDAENSLREQLSWGPYQLRANPVAILKLSLGTAGAISLALLIPDIFSLLPNANTPYILLSRAVGLFGYCYVLWASGFVCILHLMRIFGGRILLDGEGITLGRVGGKIPWDSIEAVTIAERKVFSKVFFIPAYQMTIHILKKNGKRTNKQLASFQYLKEEFFSLYYYICKFACRVEPKTFEELVLRDPNNPQMQKILDEGKYKRLLLTAIIAFGLVAFLGRKATLNYTFNMGNKESGYGHYDKAIGYYSTACAIEFSFAPAWDRLARSELRVGDIASAEEHYKEAIKWKPDFVEAKLGLSKVYILQGRYKEASELVQSAVRLAPLDEASYINQALVNSLQGKNRLAMEELESFVKQKEGRDQALCILARCYFLQGEFEKARKLLAVNRGLMKNPLARPFYTIVLAELDIADGNFDSAEKRLAPYRILALHDPELMVDVARIRIGQKKYAEAQQKLDLANQVNHSSPWILLTRAELQGSRGAKDADEWLKKAIDIQPSNASLLAAAAAALERLGRHEDAVARAKEALFIDSSNLIAQKIAGPAPDQAELQKNLETALEEAKP